MTKSDKIGIGITVLLVFLISFMLYFVSYNPWNWRGEKQYCGKVVEIFRTDAGYKSSPEAHVVFYSDSLRRNIDVKVSWNTYANCYVGKNVCFTLTKYQLEH